MNPSARQPQKTKNVVVLHAGALGDCVQALHAVAAIRAFLQCERVDMVARSPIAQIAQSASGRPTIDHAFDYDSLPWHLLHASEFAGPVEPLRAFLGEYDLVISFLGGEQDVVHRRLGEVAGAPVMALHPQPDDWAGSSDPRDYHVVVRWLHRLGIPADHPSRDARTVLATATEPAQRNRLDLHRVAGKVANRAAIIHPGSGGRSKNCPVEMLEKVARRLLDDGMAVVWLLGPTESEWHGRSLADRLASIAPVLADLSLQDAASYIAAADAYIGNDAGMTHVAAALGVPTIALFGPTDPRVWRPLGEHVSVIDYREPDAIDGVVALLQDAKSKRDAERCWR